MALDLRLYLVTDPGLCARAGLVETVRAAVAGGVRLVQLRDKRADTAARVAAGRALLEALAGTGAALIVNDDVEAAKALGVGAHIGQGDMDPAEARARLGPGAVLGLSCETAAHVAAVPEVCVDYLGLGPVFATGSKPDHAAPIGIDGFARLRAGTGLPCVAIGGVKARHAGALRGAGADGLAVVSAICGQDDPEAAARGILAQWEAGA